MPRNTLLDLAVAHSLPNTKSIIDSLVLESAILRTAGIEFANKGLSHEYKIVTSLPGVTVRGLNQGTAPTKGVSSLKQIDLKIFEAKQSEDAMGCEVYPGGVKQFFADNAPLYMEAITQAVAKSVVYGNNATFGNAKGFSGLSQAAKANGNVIQRGGASGASTSIYCVRWKPGVCGLVVPKTDGKSLDKLIGVKVLNGGNAISIPTGVDNEELTVYQAQYNLLMSLMVGSTFSVSAMTQVDGTHLPTVQKMNDLVDAVRSQPGDGMTFIYANRSGRSMIANLKDSKYYLLTRDNNYDVMLEFWRDIPLLTEDIINSVETSTLD